jgi:hypothetical protein
MVSTVIAERVRADRIDDVLAWAHSIKTLSAQGLKRTVFKRTANQVGEIDPERTAAWLEPHLGQIYSVGSLRELFRGWQPLDPDAAWAWIAKRADDAERQGAIEAATMTWVRRERSEALSWFERAALSPIHDDALTTITDELAQEPSLALTWAVRITDEDLRDRTISGVLVRWARRDPEAARTWLRTSSLPNRTRKALRAMILPKRQTPPDETIESG